MVAVLTTTTVRAEFEKVELDFGGKALTGSVRSFDPLTAEFSDFQDGVFTRMLWADQGSGFQQIYNNQTGLVGTVGDFGEDTGDFDIAGNDQGDLFFVHRLKTDLGNRGEGIILRLGENGFEEFVPPATQRLGGGANSKFYYAFPAVAGNGTVAMLGYDDRFPHFVLRVDDSSIEIIAQESVTPVPNGGGMFSRFGTDLQISSDGSVIVFRGERTDGQSGLYRWTAEGLSTVAESAMNVPDRAATLGNFFDSSIEPFMRNDGAIFMFKHASFLVRYQDGNLETLLAEGDMVEGQPVQQLSNVQHAPNGDIFAQGVRGFMRYRDGAWENFRLLDGSETADGKRLSGAYRVGPMGVYFNGSVFIREELRSEASLYLHPYDSDELIKVLDFDAETFGDASGGVPRRIVGDHVLFANQTGEYIGTVEDLSRDVDAGGAPSPGPGPQPEPVLSVFETVLAALPEAVRGANDDADGDGISNLIEFILGLPLDVASSISNGFEANVQVGADLGLEGDTNQYLTVHLRKRSLHEGITVRVLVSASLDGLAVDGQAAIEVGAAAVDGEFESQLYRSEFSIDTASNAFIGLVVEYNP